MNISNANPIIADTQSIRLNIKYINNVVAGFFFVLQSWYRFIWFVFSLEPE